MELKMEEQQFLRIDIIGIDEFDGETFRSEHYESVSDIGFVTDLAERYCYENYIDDIDFRDKEAVANILFNKVLKVGKTNNTDRFERWEYLEERFIYMDTVTSVYRTVWVYCHSDEFDGWKSRIISLFCD
jgi:hypothetical protein